VVQTREALNKSSGQSLPAADGHLALRQAAAALGLTLDARQQQALLDYVAQLQRWNRTYNLTAIRDPHDMLIQHVFDSLAIGAPLRRRWGASGDAVHALDVGSGAGLPGIVMAILQPQWHVTCVDAVEKKAVFIQQIARTLGLANVTARHARVETLARAPYAFAVSRAFASLKDFAVLAGRLLGEDGVLVAMKGKVPEAEIRDLERDTDWQVASVEPLNVPLLDAQRCLIWIERKDKEAHAPG